MKMNINKLKYIVAVTSSCFLSLYVGLWLCLIGGIVTFAESIKSNPIEPLGILWGLLKFAFSGYVAGAVFYLTFTLLHDIIFKIKTYSKL